MGIVIVLDVTKYFFTYSPAHWGWHQWVVRPPQVRWPTRPHLLGVAPVQCAVCRNICIIGVFTQELWFRIKGGLQFGLLSVFNCKIVLEAKIEILFLRYTFILYFVASFSLQSFWVRIKWFSLQTFLRSASASSCSGTSHWDLDDTHL